VGAYSIHVPRGDKITVGRHRRDRDLQEYRTGQTGIPTINKKPHLGDLLLAKFKNKISGGFDDLKRFELIDRLEKPVLNSIFTATKKTIIEMYDFISQFPYSFVIPHEKGPRFVESAGERGPSCGCAYFRDSRN